MDFSNLLWLVPFFGIIFSMSFLPLLCPNFWHKHSGKVPMFWTVLYLSSVCYVFGFFKIFEAILDPIVVHYIPFIVLIASLYITSGGIFLDFPRGYGPIFNVCFLFLGSMLAGWIGTTGAATLLIRPLLRVNADRRYKTHILVFFIFLIANIGGLATPLGDPPLFIGFLEGVDFFWFIKHLYPFLLCTSLALCFLFFVIDSVLFYRDPGIYVNRTDEPIFILHGIRNLGLIILILSLVIFCNFKSEFSLFDIKFSYASLIRNVSLAAIALFSLKITRSEIRQKNCFSMEPIKEVAELFAGIFITVTPIIYILHKGCDGELKFLFDWMTSNGEFIATRCFWASGVLSSILDNAPTFLMFFHLTSGNAIELMGAKSNILIAISISTVFMGALTYIGNAPNLMVKSISEDYGVEAPSFIGYLLWSITILVPIFFIVSMFL